MMANRDILAAVLTKWLQPSIQQLAGARLMQLPFLANIEAKIKSTGWVSPMWSMSNEIAPLLGGVAAELVEPMLANYLQGIPDQAVPNMAHQIVDNALAQGQLSLFEGNVIFERDDLLELKSLLKYNLPIIEQKKYKVKTKEEDNDTINTN